MTEPRKRKIADGSTSKEIEHVDDILKRKNQRDKGSRKYTEEKKR